MSIEGIRAAAQVQKAFSLEEEEPAGEGFKLEGLGFADLDPMVMESIERGLVQISSSMLDQLRQTFREVQQEIADEE